MGILIDIAKELETLKAAFGSPDAALAGLVLERVARWRDDCSTVETLAGNLVQILREVGFSTHEGGAKIALPVARLRDTVDATPGMTMNERLVSFDLLDRWDRTVEAQRIVLSRKLLVRQ